MSVKDIFIKPNIEPFDLNTLRVRRNMIVSSLLILFLYYISEGMGETLKGFTPFGIQGIKPDLAKINFIFMLVHFYLYIHFCWLTRDHYNSNKLRLTGPKPYLSKPTDFSEEFDPHPSSTDPLQTNYYSWWVRQKPLLINAEKTAKILEDIDEQNANKIYEKLEPIKDTIPQLINTFRLNTELIQRFDQSFWHHQRSQFLRLIIFEFGLPLLLGTWSLLLMVNIVFIKCG